MDLYIYYKVRDADAAALHSAVAAMQAQLAAQFAVTSELKRRPESAEGVQTWMEIYRAAPGDFAVPLAAAVDGAGLARWIVGARHVETFMDVVPCA